MSPNATRITPAADTDLPVISELAGVIWRACYPGIITHAQIDYMLERMYALEVMREEIRAQAIRYDLMSVDDKPAGFASYGPTEAETTRRDVQTVQRAVPAFKLHKLYILPELHGRGFGSLLLQHVEREVFGLGGRRLVLSVNKRNAKAIAAYKRNGFAIADSIVTDIGGGFVMDDYVMAKDLPAGW